MLTKRGLNIYKKGEYYSMVMVGADVEEGTTLRVITFFNDEGVAYIKVMNPDTKQIFYIWANSNNFEVI